MQDLPDLSRRLESHQPVSLLAIGPQAGALLAAYHRKHPTSTLAYLDPHGSFAGNALLAALSAHGRFDFVIVRGVLERIDADSSAHLMASLRDVHARRLCVVLGAHDGEQRWQAPQLIAMGLSHWSSESVNEATVEIYGFDLGTYKTTPDWLNARHWAHPEHWGKFRW